MTLSQNVFSENAKLRASYLVSLTYYNNSEDSKTETIKFIK